MRRTNCLTAVLVFLASTASAEDHMIGARVGLLGLGVEYGYRLSDRLTVRFGLNGSGIDFDETESGIDYAFDLNFDSLSASIDVHPMKGAFRVSAGLLKNDTELKAVGRTSSPVTIGDEVYQPSDIGTLSGAIGFDGTAPYLGVGWDFMHEKKVGISFDMGIVSQGAPIVTLSASGPIADDPAFMQDIEAERLELQNSLDDLDLYPYAMLGVLVRF